MQYGGGGHRFMKLFHKIPLFFERWLPLGWHQLLTQCIDCLFPILRAYGTVLRLETPGTDRQGIYIGVNIFSSVTTWSEGDLFTWGLLLIHHLFLFSPSWISFSLLTLHLEYLLTLHLECSLHSRLHLSSPFLLLVFTQFLSWFLPASFLP